MEIDFTPVITRFVKLFIKIAGPNNTKYNCYIQREPWQTGREKSHHPVKKSRVKIIEKQEEVPVQFLYLVKHRLG